MFMSHSWLNVSRKDAADVVVRMFFFALNFSSLAPEFFVREFLSGDEKKPNKKRAKRFSGR